MSKTRKILSLVIAVAMLISVFAVSAFAYTPTDVDRNGNHYTQTWALSEARDNGNGTWSVDVSLTTNYKVGPIEFTVANTNNSGVVLSGAVLGAAVPAAWNAEIHFYNSTGRVMIIPTTAGKSTLDGAVMNGIIATLTYTVEDGASADINIKNDPKGDGADIGGTLIAARAGDIISDKAVYGQTVLSVGETRHIGGGAADAPKLVAIEGKGGIVDENRGYIYGIDVIAGEDVTTTFEVTGGGSFVIEANGAGGAETGTGSLLKVLDADGNETGEQYYIAIFGDVSGDGAIDSTDAGYICDYEAFVFDYSEIGIDTDLALFAGDVNADGSNDSTDAGYICDYEAFVDELMPAAEIAAILYAM